MKKLILLAAFAVLGMSHSSYSQEGEEVGGQTDKGSWLIEANTGFGEASGGSTGFHLTNIDGETFWNIGLDFGYFVMDDLAIKVGLGYGDNSVSDGRFGWKFGGKYYIIGFIPVGLDLNGSAGDNYSPMFLGLQGGYAWFITDSVSVEPGLRYGFGMNEDAGDGDFNPFSFNIGFAIHL